MTIPKEIVDNLSLGEGEDLDVTEVDETIVIRRSKKGGKSDRSSRFFGKLKARTGKVEHWPTPEEVKSIWD